MGSSNLLFQSQKAEVRGAMISVHLDKACVVGLFTPNTPRRKSLPHPRMSSGSTVPEPSIPSGFFKISEIGS
jgi:hypothetical protein